MLSFATFNACFKVSISPWAAVICDETMPSAVATVKISPILPATRSSVICLPFTLTIRPLIARPAKTLSAILITCPTCGIKPCSPVLKVTVWVCNCSAFNAQIPALCACPLDVQPKAEISSVRTPYLAIASSSGISSYSVVKLFSGLSQATFDKVWRSLALVPV